VSIVGAVSRLIGLVISVIGALVVLVTVNDPTQSYIWMFIGLLIISIGLNLLTAGKRQSGHKPAPPTITEIRCTNASCDFKEIRDFQKGDFMLKSLEAKCPKCSSPMTIDGVYVVREEEQKGKSDF
jgi:sulfite exporter TauE/SafE